MLIKFLECIAIISSYKLSGRRSRSRSAERPRRYSRSPVDRPARRSRTRSRSPERRKRSPFINEIVRQFRNEGLNSSATGFPVAAANPAPMMNQPPLNHQFVPQEVRRISMGGAPVPVHQVPAAPSYGGLLPHPGTSFMNFEARPVQAPVVPFDHQIQLQPTEYAAAPVLYNQQQQPCPVPIGGPSGHYPAPVPSPQPVPAPKMVSPIMNARAGYYPDHQIAAKPLPGPSVVEQLEQRRRRSVSPSHRRQKERLRTPEPPVISGPEVIIVLFLNLFLFFDSVCFSFTLYTIG